MATRSGRSSGRRAFALGCAIAMALSCGEQRGKLVPSDSGTGGQAGGAAGGVQASGAAGGGQVGVAAGGGHVGGAGAGGQAGGAGAGGQASSDSGTSSGGSAGASSPDDSCVYRAELGVTSSRAPGEGGAGGATATITKGTSRLIGDYLADSRGFALYVFGGDMAGDCESPPVSGCTGDCLLSWPVFHVEERLLAEGLDEAAFGSILRDDGLSQTTYFGWPLYFYASDTKPGDVIGHGAGVWGLAETILPNVVVRRVGMDRFLTDGGGHTLYAFSDDTLGSANKPAQSACLGACAVDHPPFVVPYVGAISTLEPRDFGNFVREDRDVQVTYKGAPLYFSALDERPGDVKGAEEPGFRLVLR